jgi:class 3 adenylate cyclase
VRARQVNGSLVFMDISGFTAMSERLAKKGKIGAEEVTEVMDAIFTRLLAAAYDEGGSLLKFGGDALLLLFTGSQHPLRACRAAYAVRALLRKEGRFTTSAGKVRLQMSVGVHSGDVHMFLLGSSHLELLVTGPAVTTVAEMETAANAGEIRVSDATASALPASALAPIDGGWLLATSPPAAVGDGFAAPPLQELADAERFVSRAIREHLVPLGTAESEHRHAVICFIRYKGVDSLITESGLEDAARTLGHLVESVQRVADDLGLCFLATDVAEDGGKFILTAGVPRSAGNDEEAMLRAVTALTSSYDGLPLQIGVNGGPVFAGDIGPAYRRTYTIMGDAVNLASRLMAKAPAGAAITVPAVIARARTQFDVTPLEPFYVKGKTEPVTAVVLGRPLGARDARQDDRLPLVGREQ